MDLEKVQEEFEAKRKQKLELAQECVIVANGFLLEAEAVKFEDREGLKLASRYFLKALELDLRLVEAYLGLIFIACLVNQYDKAKILVQQVQAIDPDNKRIKALKKEAQRLSAMGRVQNPVTRESMLKRIRENREAAKQEMAPLQMKHVTSLRTQMEAKNKALQSKRLIRQEAKHKKVSLDKQVSFDPVGFSIFDDINEENN